MLKFEHTEVAVPTLKWPHQVSLPKKLMKVGSKEYEAWKQELNDALMKR